MLVKWKPSALSGIFDDFFNDDFRIAGRDMSLTMPAVNVKEEENNFVVEVAAPGLNKEDFSLNIQDNVLKITASKEEEREDTKEGQYTRKEFNYSSFERSFTLPENVNADQINARYENGVLNIHMPKKEVDEARVSKRIEIS